MSADLRSEINSILEQEANLNIQILSATPQWIQLRFPCNPTVVPVLQQILILHTTDINDETKETISLALREMLNNAIEHGGKFDLTKYVEVASIRLKHAIIFKIKDPGDGFDPEHLEHAAVNNPATDPFRHVSVRDEKGLRAGGFGILLTNQLVDELVYNERRNEVLFIKYL